MKSLHIFVLLAAVLLAGTIVASQTYEKAKIEVVAGNSCEKPHDLVNTVTMSAAPTGEEVNVEYVPGVIGTPTDGIVRRQFDPPVRLCL